jgi:colicin import membrane protein
MIRTAILGALLALPLLGGAQESPEAAELARINAQRERAEAEFAAQEKACYSRFAVNDCIEAARKRRRDALAELRRQEVALNDAERRRRADERLRDIEARQAEQRVPAPLPLPVPAPAQGGGVARDPAAPPAANSPLAQPATPASAAIPPAGRGKARSAAAAASAPADARTPKVTTPPSATQSQENARRYQERLLEAQEHKKRAQEKAAENNKASRPLPVPP